MTDEHTHDAPHAHEHEHDGETHVHAHTAHDHDHVEHEHDHAHDGDAHAHAARPRGRPRGRPRARARLTLDARSGRGAGLEARASRPPRWRDDARVATHGCSRSGWRRRAIGPTLERCRSATGFAATSAGSSPTTRRAASIGASTREDLFGELIDAMPGKWLVWHAGGLLGPRRYACPDHRKALLKSIRFHYAYAGEQWVWKRPPYPQRWPPDGIGDEPDGTLDDPGVVRARAVGAAGRRPRPSTGSPTALRRRAWAAARRRRGARDRDPWRRRACARRRRCPPAAGGA